MPKGAARSHKPELSAAKPREHLYKGGHRRSQVCGNRVSEAALRSKEGKYLRKMNP